MTRRILFVDDEQRVLDALRRMLRAQRHVWDMVCMNDPQQAWERLQDIGKIGIPDAILLKREPLEAAEWSMIQQHTTIGARILLDDTAAARMFEEWSGSSGKRPPRESANPVLATAARIALSHHERWDGAGYPTGLAGERIPLEARIVAVADVFDALTSPRPYKPALSESAALEIMRRSASGHFDPTVYAAFLRALPVIQPIRTQITTGREGVATHEETGHAASTVCR